MNRSFSIGALLLCLTLAALDQTAIATALPTIGNEFGSSALLNWVMSAYLLTATLSTPLWGKFSDIYGRRLLLQCSVILFIVGSVLAGFSSDIVGLVASRAIQGIGGGGMIVLVFAAIADLVSPIERGRFVGFFGAAFGLASVLGPLMGGILTQAASWRWIFFLNIPLGLIALLSISVCLQSPRRSGGRRIDWLGALLLSIAIGGVMFGLLSADSALEMSVLATIALFTISALAVVMLVKVEKRAVDPLLPLKVITHPVVRTTASLGFVVGLVTIGTIVYAPAYLQGALGSTPASSGLQLLPFIIGMLVSSIAVGRLISRTGAYETYPIAGTIVAALGFLMLTQLTANTQYVWIGFGLFCAGLGIGAIIPVLTVASQSAVTHGDIGAVTSISSLARSLGSTFGATAFGLIWSMSLTASLGMPESTTPSEVATASNATFMVAAIVMAAAVALALFLPRVRLRSSVGPE